MKLEIRPMSAEEIKELNDSGMPGDDLAQTRQAVIFVDEGGHNRHRVHRGRTMSEKLFEMVEPKTWSFLLASLKKHEAENRHGFWTDGEQILCHTEGEAKTVADFLEDLGFDCVMTGYYDPEEDTQSGQTDDHTGCWYVSID